MAASSPVRDRTYPRPQLQLAETKMWSEENPPSSGQVKRALAEVLGPNLAGYDLKQVNGQRVFFNPSPHVRNATPPEGSEVFVGRLPRDLFEDELVPPFLKIGPIYQLRLMMNFSGTNRGFAFVSYFEPKSATRAIRELDNFEIRSGHNIGVLESVNNRKLLVDGLPINVELDFSCLRWATEGVEDITVFHSKRFPVKCALVSYTTHRAAAMARRKLIPIKDQLFGRSALIDWADPRLPYKQTFRGSPKGHSF